MKKIKKIKKSVGLFFKRTKAVKLKKTLIFIFKFSLKTFFILITVIFFTVSLFVIGVHGKYAGEFNDAKPKTNGTQAIFYDKDGNIIYEGFGAKEPEYVPLDQIPEVVKNATLAAEDINFYKHGPVDMHGIARAIYSNYTSSDSQGIGRILDLLNEGEYSQGGSTITQQLIKIRYLSSERSFERKTKEFIYSLEMEKKLTKDKILEEYLNYIPYGEQSIGIQNASKIYFGKNISELNLAEASLLAGLPQAPSKYSPITGDFEQSKKRQEYVLQQMILADFISIEEGKEAANAPLIFTDKRELILKYPFFVQYIKQELIKTYGSDFVEEGGIRVYTTLDPTKQETAERIAAEYVEKFKSRNVSNAAVVALDNETNNILAMVGGVDWQNSKVNVATSLRQPGSSFKPIVYATGFIQGYSPGTKLLDTYVNFGGTPPYVPKNYDGSYYGNVSVRSALANSLNIPAVEMTQLVGIDNVIETAYSLGIRTITNSPESYGLSLGLGSAEVKLLELVGAYSTFADNGKRTLPNGIIKIQNGQGEEILKIERQKKEVIDPRAAFMINDILSDTKARRMIFGTGNKLEIKGHTVAAKTGTTDNYSDSWTLGYTPDITVGVWMGNNDRSQMKVISGIEGAAYVWHDIMQSYLTDIPDKPFIKPGGLSEVWISPYTFSQAPKEGSPYVLEYYLPGKEPTSKPDFSYLEPFNKTYSRINN